MPAVVRPATEEDLSQLASLVLAGSCSHISFELAHLPNLVREGRVICLEEAGRIGAFLCIDLDQPNCHIRGLALRPGSACPTSLGMLMAELVKRAKAVSAQSVVAIARSAWLVRLLESWGFVLAGHLVSLRARLPLRPSAKAQATFPIRRAQPEDLEALVAIEKEAFGPDWRNGPATVAEYIRHMSRFLVAVDGDTPIGYVCAQQQARRAHIARLAVRPRYQRQHVGTELMLTLAQELQEADVRSLTLNTQRDNEAALSFYRALGFAREGALMRIYRLAILREGPANP